MKKLTIVTSVIVLAVVILVAYLIMGNPSDANAGVSETANKSTITGNVVVIPLEASRFQYNQSTITVKKGDHVKILIANKDTTHGLSIPALGVSGIDSVEFDATTAGTYEFRCPTMCGSGHRGMVGTLIVTE